MYKFETDIMNAGETVAVKVWDIQNNGKLYNLVGIAFNDCASSKSFDDLPFAVRTEANNVLCEKCKKLGISINV